MGWGIDSHDSLYAGIFVGDYFVFRMDIVKWIELKNSMCIHTHKHSDIRISHVRDTLDKIIIDS